MSFSVVSYNVLADAYVKPSWYPGVPPELLAQEYRLPALTRHLERLGADVFCLQEVEADVYWPLEGRLAALGYEGHHVCKGGNKPDGCSTLVRKTAGAVRAVRPLRYADGSGHVALLVVLGHDGLLVGIANTHLKWDPPGTPRAAQRGYGQITEFLQERDRVEPRCDDWIVCGDFNVTADSDVIRALTAAGFRDAYRGYEHMNTCNANQNARRIDFLLHTAGLSARPAALPPIANHTPLPSEDEPSDHLPIMAWFERARPEGGPLSC
jgi:mRNA deadenylase 3'-5' endonuclease subunit Ccr4